MPPETLLCRPDQRYLPGGFSPTRPDDAAWTPQHRPPLASAGLLTAGFFVRKYAVIAPPRLLPSP
ncbi:hypothetical protein HYPSUDRAFT_200184 [Hypholoma sublateritium FD-334 SS-4]|uniref:Uncharacterized protein n=1 Tax=Hypholoma sublateritium (strain FD-334 SS-4) TaxID=945553 RepID=A0A0D2Q016_HYPSF|nr:hypothetical protein HYPSUDRAFT_200184 [Hypholoma sublateritium FD-334 SS-4]